MTNTTFLTTTTTTMGPTATGHATVSSIDQTDLERFLDDTAHRIDAEGTHGEAATLEWMAAITRTMCPGAAAALADWDGSEIARLRAFGMVHGVLVRQLRSVRHDVQAIVGAMPVVPAGVAA